MPADYPKILFECRCFLSGLWTLRTRITGFTVVDGGYGRRRPNLHGFEMFTLMRPIFRRKIIIEHLDICAYMRLWLLLHILTELLEDVWACAYCCASSPRITRPSCRPTPKISPNTQHPPPRASAKRTLQVEPLSFRIQLFRRRV